MPQQVKLGDFGEVQCLSRTAEDGVQVDLGRVGDGQVATNAARGGLFEDQGRRRNSFLRHLGNLILLLRGTCLSSHVPVSPPHAG